MNNEDRDLVEARGVTMYPQHWAIAEQYAKDMGYNGVSAALRRIITEWAELKARQLVDSRPAYITEQA